ncbi:GNAT family N-acetyltransferase [uncultured Shewanella sp.]|uniref:GNAT family N-acetyltransferase n=1 Tax=uncultured Shewanella sp. TaxID=173975 RepID=UPI00261C00C2|nr:GNAT family N-acetyltransferase [uncultured Shewanella sp.]
MELDTDFIRLATHQDVDRIWAIRTQAILTSCAEFYAAQKVAVWADSPMPTDFADILVTLKAIVYEEKGQVLGFGFIDSDKQSLESVFVDPSHHGKGIGKALALALQQQAINAGITRLSLSASLNAVPFYKRLGFIEQASHFWQHPSGVKLECVPMTKALLSC